MPDNVLAALDLGSNTFRLILASQDLSGLKPKTQRVWQELPRLSEGLVPGGYFRPEPLKRAWEALYNFQKIIETEKPLKILAGATMAVRLAADGPDFLAKITHQFGWETILLTGHNEARLSALGVLSGLASIPKNGLIFDLGGRSTEFINTQDSQIVKTQSLDMGVVGLTEEFIASDPPRPQETAALTQKVKNILSKADWSSLGQDFSLIGTAGTVTTVAAMLLGMADYDPARFQNTQFSRHDILSLSQILAQEPLARRLGRPGLHPRRADVIVAGIFEVAAIMDYFSMEKLTVSDASLLEGLWLAAAGLTSLSLT